MPRLSLYKPEKGNDYKFLDRSISEMFQVGGTDIYLHKYLGPKNPSQADATADQPLYTDGDGNPIVKETNIQDLLFLENRDRTYDSSIYTLRGIYNVADIDFNLSQFGLFIDQDTVFMTVHINDFIQYIGRKPMSGDVLELPHLRDEFALSTFDVSLPRYYAIEDVGRASEGFSVGNTVTQTFSDGVIMSGEVSNWNDSDKILSIIHAGASDGLYHAWTTLKLVSAADGSVATVTAIGEDNKLSENEANSFYETTADDMGFLDFSEGNPFGDVQ